MFSRLLHRSTASPSEPLDAAEEYAVSQRDRWIRSGWPLLGGILGLGLASLGEALIEAQKPSTFTLFCYLVGISIFVLSGSYLPPPGEDTPGIPLERSSERLSNLVDQRARWLILGSGVALAV